MRTFRTLSFVTVVAVYLLILVGGIVRSTGSGMGCPDWPKCFGSWVPPTSEDQLPDDYQEQYVSKRLAKNARLTGYFQSLGFTELAHRIANDPNIQEEQPFNAVKTWIEYVNRLVGVIIGLLILATLISSLKYWRHKRRIVWFSLAAFVLTGIQGWIGSIVVSTNLLHGMINVHLFLAIIIVILLIYAMYLARERKPSQISSRSKSVINWLVAISIVGMMLQIVFGVEVRALVDQAADILGPAQRGRWIASLPNIFKVHRTYSLLILALHGALVYVLLKHKLDSVRVWKTGVWLAVITGVEILTGAIMAYFAIPSFMQPVHLLFATLIMGVQFYVLLLVNTKEHAVQAMAA
ncbi:MAG: COX15/CtaA family protein [Bacteroidota bacterium]